MRWFLSAVLSAGIIFGATATVSIPTPAFAFQQGSETFPGNGGTYNGHVIESITINYDTNIITYHYADGGQYTFGQSHDFCVGFGNYLRQRNVQE